MPEPVPLDDTPIPVDLPGFEIGGAVG